MFSEYVKVACDIKIVGNWEDLFSASVLYSSKVQSCRDIASKIYFKGSYCFF